MNQNDLTAPVIPVFAGMMRKVVIPAKAGIHDASWAADSVQNHSGNRSTMNQNDLTASVIPACARMMWLSSIFNLTGD